MRASIQLTAAAIVAAAVTWPVSGLAQSYPTKAVRLVVPFPPGGGVDATARVLGKKLTDQWSQQVIVDNRTGAGTTIGNEIAAKAAPDGYTLLLTNNALAISAGLYSKLRYDTAKELLPVMEILRSPFVMVIPANSPMKSVQDLIAAAKAKPGELTLANTGVGSGPHLAGVLFANMAGIKLNEIPYKGGGPAIVDLAAGRVNVLLTTPLAAMPHVQSGRLRAIGVTSARRAADLPSVPSLAESGLSGYDVSTWYMLLAPTGTPKALVTRVYNDAKAGLGQADAVKALSSGGTELVFSTPEDSAKLLRAELARWAKVIREANVKPEN